MLHAYLVVLLVFNVLPLDLTLSPVELFHKWHEGRITLLPFGAMRGDFADALYATVTNALIWIAPGVLWALQPGATLVKVLLRGLAAAIAIEFAQLFVYSRYTDVNQVIHAGVGVGVGWFIARHSTQKLPGLFGMLARNWWQVWVVWAGLTLGVFWYPFNFSADELNAVKFVTAFTRVPFTTYYFGTEYHAINELLRKVGFFWPGGILLGLTLYKSFGDERRAAVLSVVMLGTLAFAVELGQLALPGKVADITDAFLEFAGGMLGYKMALWMGAPGAQQTFDANAQPPPVNLWLPGYKAHIVFVLLMAMGLWGLLALPGIPYNVRELVAPGPWGVVSVLGLCTVAYGMANGGFVLIAQSSFATFLMFPLGLLVHGLLAWCLLRLIIPLESLHDVVGSPVLGWPWEWEMLGRYLALHASIMLQVLGATLLVRAILDARGLAPLVYWLMVNVALAVPLYAVVVQWAATDNLTELMAGNASFWAASALALGLLMICLAGSAASAALNARSHSGLLLGLVLCAALGAALLFWLGAEDTIVKYGKVFSAFQFLLSTDREHYAQGADLVLRQGVALVGACVGLGAMQWLAWRRLSQIQ